MTRRAGRPQGLQIRYVLQAKWRISNPLGPPSGLANSLCFKSDFEGLMARGPARWQAPGIAKQRGWTERKESPPLRSRITQNVSFLAWRRNSYTNLQFRIRNSYTNLPISYRKWEIRIRKCNFVYEFDQFVYEFCIRYCKFVYEFRL